ncbi:unnamed protein product [Adineta ricciae]|uniref:Uncharacterized protein n=1 Tax=Adineta ricciae TaxID=249248 RepID=A0A815R4E1_ADIRI|nr:unnamed protein product [Adineta ricciae]
MTANCHSLNKNKDLLNRLTFLEKFIELKSNECAYYRTKVHLMQMNSGEPQLMKTTSIRRSSSEDITQSSASIEYKHRTSSIPVCFRRSSVDKKLSNPSIPFDRSKHVKYRKEKRNSAQNQNYCEKNDKIHPANRFFNSYINRNFQHVSANHKNIQCNVDDLFRQHEISSRTTLIIQLPRRFIKSLIKQQNNSITPKLKVHLSSELLHKLLRSMNTNTNPSQGDKFAIQSQFGTIAASINHEVIDEQQESKVIQAKAEVKSCDKNRLTIVRHIARTKADDHERVKHRHHRRKTRHIHRFSSTSREKIDSKRSSRTNLTSSIKTLSSSN